MQHATTVSVIHLSYGTGKCLKKIQELLSLWVDDLKIKTTTCCLKLLLGCSQKRSMLEALQWC
jgi:hypothetical protein